jgi:hypothetical protein
MKSANQVRQKDAKAAVDSLIAIGDQLEAADDPRWFPVARAAALLESLRLGVAEVAPHYSQRHEVRQS